MWRSYKWLRDQVGSRYQTQWKHHEVRERERERKKKKSWCVHVESSKEGHKVSGTSSEDANTRREPFTPVLSKAAESLGPGRQPAHPAALFPY